VIEAVHKAMAEDYANVHRGDHYLSQVATDQYEAARATVARFVNAASADEIVFTRNATEAINLVAASYGRKFLKAGDEVVISHMEHHANIVPWQLLRDEVGIVLKVIPIDDAGNLRMDAYRELLGPRTRLVAVTHASNVLGTVNPVKEIARLAHDQGALVLIDGAQGAVHAGPDVRDLDVDFYALTGHKLYGPTGIGALYGRMELLESMPPYQGGGEMITHVTFAETTFKRPPARFEAGTPPIVQAIGLGAAIGYVESLGADAIAAQEQALLAYATERLSGVPGLTIQGRANDKCSIVSFTIDGIHAHDIGTIVDRAGVAVRAGHHCANPLMDRFDVPATVRASFAMYNTMDEVDALVEALHMVREVFG
jgi:cysteine desulfurase/selenocysteine lyase